MHESGFQSTQTVEIVAIKRQQKTRNLGSRPNSAFNLYADSRSPWRPLYNAGSLTSRWHPLQSFFSRLITREGEHIRHPDPLP